MEIIAVRKKTKEQQINRSRKGIVLALIEMDGGVSWRLVACDQVLYLAIRAEELLGLLDDLFDIG